MTLASVAAEFRRCAAIKEAHFADHEARKRSGEVGPICDGRLIGQRDTYLQAAMLLEADVEFKLPERLEALAEEFDRREYDDHEGGYVARRLRELLGDK